MLIYSIVRSGLKALFKLELSFDIEADPYFFMSGTAYHHFSLCASHICCFNRCTRFILNLELPDFGKALSQHLLWLGV